MSGVVSTPANTFVIELTNRVQADSTAWMAQVQAQRQTAIAILQQQRLQEWIMALRTAARIVDRRDVVLAPQDPDAMPQLPMVF